MGTLLIVGLMAILALAACGQGGPSIQFSEAADHGNGSIRTMSH